MEATVTKEFHECQGRMYIGFKCGTSTVSAKVPYRYKRVMCTVDGFKTIQELQIGDKVTIKGNIVTYKDKGAWVLEYINTDTV